MTKINEPLIVDLTTGEIVDPGTPGAVTIPAEEVRTPPDEPDDAWLGDWMTRQLVELDAVEAAMVAVYEQRRRVIKARRRYLDWKYSDRLEAVTRAALKGKRQSVDYAYGRAGFSRSKRRVVEDQAAAIEWAEAHDCEDAIKRCKPTLLKSNLPEKCPHMMIEEINAFYVRGHKPPRPG